MKREPAHKRLLTVLTRLRVHLPTLGGRPRSTAPERFVVGGPLDTINDDFHDAHEAFKTSAQQEVPVFVVLADELILFFRGERTVHSFAPHGFHVIKSVTHAPLALYATLYRYDGGPLDGEAQRTLTALHKRVAEALARVEQDASELAEHTRTDLRAVLSACLRFLSSEHEAVSLAALDQFARQLGPVLLRLADDATALQLAALHEHVEQTLGKLDRSVLASLQVVIAGDHQARERSLAMQYFQKRLAEPASHERRVCYAEGVADEEAALALVGTRRLDHALGRAFFENEARLQRDILGDAAKARLDQTELALIG